MKTPKPALCQTALRAPRVSGTGAPRTGTGGAAGPLRNAGAAAGGGQGAGRGGAAARGRPPLPPPRGPCGSGAGAGAGPEEGGGAGGGGASPGGSRRAGGRVPTTAPRAAARAEAATAAARPLSQPLGAAARPGAGSRRGAQVRTLPSPSPPPRCGRGRRFRSPGRGAPVGRRGEERTKRPAAAVAAAAGRGGGGAGRAPVASRPLGAVGDRWCGAGSRRPGPRACSLSRARALTEGVPGPKFAAGRPCGPAGAVVGGKGRGAVVR